MRKDVLAAGLSLGAVAAVTGTVFALRTVAPVVSLGALYVFAVLPVAVLFGLGYSLVVALLSGLAFNFFFLAPVHTLHLRDSENWVAIAVALATAIVVSELAARMRRRAAEAQLREREAALLAEVAALLLGHGGVQPRLKEISERVGKALGSRRAWIELGSLRRSAPGESGYDLAVGERHVGRLFLDEGLRLRERTRLLTGLASILGAALDREALARTAVEAEALRRTDEAKTAVLRAVSHDLRSPLTAIRAAAEGLEHHSLALTDADRAELLGTIAGETQRLDRLVRNLLDLSRLEVGGARARPELWPVDALLGRALEAVGERSAGLEVSAPGDVPAVRVDPTQIERAIVNLVENALAVSADVAVSVSQSGEDVVVAVADRGPGFAPGEAERIFEPFERGAAGARGGTGLGLAIARGFVEANEGRIWAEPREGGGAVVSLALPAVREPAAAW